jgi:CBS domain-containing protein
MKVSEIMSQDVVSVKPDDSAKDALALLSKMQISGLPVINEQNKLVGMFTEKEVLAAILPSYVERVGRFMYRENPKAIRHKIAQLGNMKVKELMRKEVATVDEDASLCEVARIMLTQKIRRLPVLNKAGKVIGIVARADIMKGFSREYGL